MFGRSRWEPRKGQAPLTNHGPPGGVEHCFLFLSILSVVGSVLALIWGCANRVLNHVPRASSLCCPSGVVNGGSAPVARVAGDVVFPPYHILFWGNQLVGWVAAQSSIIILRTAPTTQIDPHRAMVAAVSAAR